MKLFQFSLMTKTIIFLRQMWQTLLLHPNYLYNCLIFNFTSELLILFLLSLRIGLYSIDHFHCFLSFYLLLVSCPSHDLLISILPRFTVLFSNLDLGNQFYLVFFPCMEAMQISCLIPSLVYVLPKPAPLNLFLIGTL